MRRGGRGGGRAGGLLRRADSLCGCHSYREEAEPTRLTHFFTLHDQNTKLSLTRPPLLSSLKENIPSTAKNKFQVYPSLALVVFFFLVSVGHAERSCSQKHRTLAVSLVEQTPERKAQDQRKEGWEDASRL